MSDIEHISGHWTGEIVGDTMPRLEAHTWSECDDTCTDVPGRRVAAPAPVCACGHGQGYHGLSDFGPEACDICGCEDWQAAEVGGSAASLGETGSKLGATKLCFASIPEAPLVGGLINRCVLPYGHEGGHTPEQVDDGPGHESWCALAATHEGPCQDERTRLELNLRGDLNRALTENEALFGELELARAEVEQLTEGNRVLFRDNEQLRQANADVAAQTKGDLTSIFEWFGRATRYRAVLQKLLDGRDTGQDMAPLWGDAAEVLANPDSATPEQGETNV